MKVQCNPIMPHTHTHTQSSKVKSCIAHVREYLEIVITKVVIVLWVMSLTNTYFYITES